MTPHDKGVLKIARSLLKKGAKKIEIGQRVASRRKILDQLKKEFPRRTIAIEGNVDLLAGGAE